MRKLSAPAAFFATTIIIAVALSIALSFILSGDGATFTQKFEIFPLALPFALMFTGVGTMVVGFPVLKFLRARHLDANLPLLVGCGVVGGCVYAVIITHLFDGAVPSNSDDIRFFFGLGGGLGALGGALWWLIAQPKPREVE